MIPKTHLVKISEEVFQQVKKHCTGTYGWKNTNYSQFIENAILETLKGRKKELMKTRHFGPE
jgi:hypothetical protein